MSNRNDLPVSAEVTSGAHSSLHHSSSHPPTGRSAAENGPTGELDSTAETGAAEGRHGPG